MPTETGADPPSDRPKARRSQRTARPVDYVSATPKPPTVGQKYDARTAELIDVLRSDRDEVRAESGTLRAELDAIRPQLAALEATIRATRALDVIAAIFVTTGGALQGFSGRAGRGATYLEAAGITLIGVGVLLIATSAFSRKTR